MNTPVHITLALSCFGKKDQPKYNLWIFLGALMPDIPIFVLFFWETLIKTPQHIIWSERYYSTLWQNIIDCFNSLPLVLAIYILALHKRWMHVQVFCLALIIHIATDFPLHHDDGHGHFFPFSSWKFESPVSYWDPNHYGNIWSLFEIILLIVTSYLAYKILHRRVSKIILFFISAVMITISVAMPLIKFLA